MDRDKHSRPRQIVEESGPALLRRLPSYVYLSDLWLGRRVIEIGCGDGSGAAYLARSGAAQVLGLDRSPANIDLARARQRTANLGFAVADFGALNLEDDAVDVICVPAGAELARWANFLDEARRVLAPDGCIILSVPSSDRGGATSGMGYHDLRGRLAPVFGDVRMIGVTPFVGFALVEYDEADVVSVELDTSLTSEAARDPVTEYVAVAGTDLGETRGFMVVEIPATDGLAALAQARGAGTSDRVLADRLADAEAVAQSALARLAELEATSGRRGEDSELKRRLTRTMEERNAVEVEVLALRSRLGQADEELGRVAAQAAREVNESRRQVLVAGGRGDALEAQMVELGRELEARTAALAAKTRRAAELESELRAALARPEPAARPEAQAQLELMARAATQHEAEMRSRLQELVERDAYIEELRQELEDVAVAERAAAEAARETSVRLVDVETELRELRRRLSAAEGEALRLRHEAAAAPAGPDPRVADLETALADKVAAADKLTARWKEAEGKSDELWRKIGELQKELGQTREQAVETARQQRQAAQIALTRAVDEASKKLVSAQDAATRADKETATVRVRAEAEAARVGEQLAHAEAKATEARQRADRAEAELERARQHHAGAEGEIEQSRQRGAKAEAEVEQGRQRIAWLEVELSRPRVDPSVIGLREELDRERDEHASAETEITRLQRALAHVTAQAQAQAETTSPTPGEADETPSSEASTPDPSAEAHAATGPQAADAAAAATADTATGTDTTADTAAAAGAPRPRR